MWAWKECYWDKAATFSLSSSQLQTVQVHRGHHMHSSALLVHWVPSSQFFVLQQSCFTRFWIKGSLNMSSLTSRTMFFISSYGIPYYPRKIERLCVFWDPKFSTLLLSSLQVFFFPSKASVLLNTYKYFDTYG